MYYYVEYMRAKRAMRVIAIILGVIVVALGIGRIWMMKYPSPESFAAMFESTSGAHVTQTTLPGGMKETVVNDPVKRVHTVIDRKGDYLRIQFTEPDSIYEQQPHDIFSPDDDRQTVSVNHGIAHGTYLVRQHNTFDVSGVLQISMIIALITATLLAAPLTKENDGHLELTWTKPISRTAYACACVAVDAAAIVVSQIFTLVVAFCCYLMFASPEIRLTSVTVVLLSLLGPIVWYAMMTAIGASVKRGPGLVIGLSWVASFLVFGIAKASEDAQSSLGRVIHAISQGVAYLDPLAYITTNNGNFAGNGAVTTVTESIAALIVLAVLYIVSAVLQWRRVEA